MDNHTTEEAAEDLPQGGWRLRMEGRVPRLQGLVGVAAVVLVV